MKIKLTVSDLLLYGITGLIFVILGGYILYSGDYSLVYILSCIAFLWCVKYALNSFCKNVFFFCFLLCFFTFLLGGQVINKFLDVYYYDFSDKIEFHADFVILISLVGVFTGYVLTDYFTKKKSNFPQKLNYNSLYYSNARYLSKYIFFITYLFYVVILLDVVIHVLQHGYLSYYLSYSTRIPAILRLIGYICPVAFCVFLATMPTKKEAMLPIILYVGYSFLSLATGRRINFMTGLLTVFAYMMLRNVVGSDKKPWISKKMIVGICLAVPVLLAAMYLFEYIRSDHHVGTANQYSPILGFFVRQGTSVNVIKYSELYKSNLDPDAYYSLKNTIQWLQDSFWNDLLSLDLAFDFGKQSVDTALNGTYLADFVSYHANKKSYLNGAGYGSCYVQELYIDFGYVGVLIGNIFYGFLLCKLFKCAVFSRNIWLTAIGLFTIENFFKAPRATFDAFFGQFLYIQNWGMIVFIFVITNWLCYKYKDKNIFLWRKNK